MHPFFQEYIERLTQLHSDLIDVLERLPPAALDWQPAPHMNSIAVLIAHTAGAERFWIGDVTVRGSSARNRADEFQVSGLNHATLKALLAATLADSKAALAQLAVEQLTAECPSPTHDETFTVGWSLLHALEHTATHVGHIQLMGDLWQLSHNEKGTE